MGASIKNKYTFKYVVVPKKKNQDYRHVQMISESAAVFHDQNQTDYFTWRHKLSSSYAL